MTTITILPEKADSYRALAGDKESTGRTAGEALDALTTQLEDEESGTSRHRAEPPGRRVFQRSAAGAPLGN